MKQNSLPHDHHDSQFYYTFRDVLTVLFKHKQTILLVFFVTAITASAAAFLLPPTYEATSTLLIKIGREHIYRPEVGTTNPTFVVDREATINSEVAIATSRDLVLRTLEVLTVATVYPELEGAASLDEALERVHKKLSVKQEKNSNVIEIAFQHRNPELTARFVNTLVDLLKEKHLRMFSDPNASFLEKQVTSYKEKLDESNSALEKYKRGNGLSSLAEERRLLLEHLKEMDAALKSVQRDSHAQKRRLVSLETQKRDIPEFVSLSSISEDHHLLDNAKSSLLELQRKEQELLTKYKDRSRFVIEIRKQIELIENFIREQEMQLKDRVTRGKNPVYQQIEMEVYQAAANLQGFLSKEDEIKGQLRELQNKLSRLDGHERALAALELEVSTDRNNYEMYARKAEEAGISEEMDRLKIANISVIQPAFVPLKPMKPNKPLTIASGIAVGLVAGIALSVLLEYMEGGYTRPEQLERDLEVPILASVVVKA
jgi:polysaccharide chain length determinant protein (PEP-CTERM system associated)